MGHIANYAIREQNRVDLFYSHWGAKTVPADVFWGPEATESFIRRNDPLAEWVDSCEGGIALDKDRRQVFFFDEGELLGKETIESTYLRLARAVWAEQRWELSRARDLGELLDFLGIPRDQVIPPPPPPQPFPLQRVGENECEGQGGSADRAHHGGRDD